MFTSDDRLLFVLFCCEDGGVTAKRLTGYSKLFNLIGLDYSFRYKVSVKGLYSESLNSYISELTSNGFIYSKDKKIYLTEESMELLADLRLTMDEFEKIRFVQDLLSSLSDCEVEFVALVDKFVYSVLEDFGASGLATRREGIVRSLDALTSCYSEENFDNALKILRLIREKGDLS